MTDHNPFSNDPDADESEPDNDDLPLCLTHDEPIVLVANPATGDIRHNHPDIDSEADQPLADTFNAIYATNVPDPSVSDVVENIEAGELDPPEGYKLTSASALHAFARDRRNDGAGDHD